MLTKCYFTDTTVLSFVFNRFSFSRLFLSHKWKFSFDLNQSDERHGNRKRVWLFLAEAFYRLIFNSADKNNNHRTSVLFHDYEFIGESSTIKINRRAKRILCSNHLQKFDMNNNQNSSLFFQAYWNVNGQFQNITASKCLRVDIGDREKE